MTSKPRVLFLCTGNSCRSQMAEGFLRSLAGERFEALSAGTDPQGIHPRATSTMAALGVDISGQSSDSIESYLDDPPEVVIAVCDRAASACPVLVGVESLLRWPFPDPAEARGSEAEIAAEFEAIAKTIRTRIAEWLEQGAPRACASDS